MHRRKADPQGISSLYHKVLDYPMKDDAVVVASLRKKAEIFCRPGRDVFQELKSNCAFVRVYNSSTIWH